MNTEELKKLLEKYYEGTTSESEELAIRKFFSKKNIPSEFEAEKEIFGFYSSLENIPEPSTDFEEKIMSAVNNSISTSGEKRRFVISLLGAAAGVLILIGTYFFFVYQKQPRDTFSDPQLAYAETMKILYDVSSRLNKCTESLKPVGKIHEVRSKSFKTINRSTLKVEENMKNLNYLNKAMDIINVPSNDKINN
jgi:hypothetical protein